MGERRMFSKKIVETDRFLDLPLSAQRLYFHIGLNRDDEGFVGNPKSIQRMIGASNDDMRLLRAKNLVQVFDSGVAHITDWNENNYIRKDRRQRTIYIEEARTVDYQATTDCQPDDNQTTAQVKKRKEKTREYKLSLDYTNRNEAEPCGICSNVFLTEEQKRDLRDKLGDRYQRELDYFSEQKAQRGYTYRSDYKAIIAWNTKLIKELAATKTTQKKINDDDVMIAAATKVPDFI